MNRQDALALVESLMAKHQLTAAGWRFEWDHAKRRFGLCSYRARTISLSLPLVELNGEAECRDTMLHEIAHALAGPGAKHKLAWKLMAQAIGARPVACVSAARVVLPPIKKPWIISCPNCTYSRPASRKTARAALKACSACCRQHNGGKWDARFVMVWTRRQDAEVTSEQLTSERNVVS